MKSNKYIEIVRSTTRGLSSMSQESCDAVFTVLTEHYTEVKISIINDVADLEALAARGPDLVFLGMEYIPANAALGPADSHRIWLSDYFDRQGIAYTGSCRTAHELQRNKPLAKQRVLDMRLKTSPFHVIERNQSFSENDVPLTFPLFIKPTNRGGGFGIDSDSVAHNFGQLRAKVDHLTSVLQTDALVEEYLPGREFSIAILRDEYSDGYVAMPIELIAPLDENGVRLLSSRVKTSNTERVLEVTDEVVKSQVNTLALDVFEALEARDYGRIDIRLDEYGVPHFLEANLIPSLISGYGSFPKACVLNAGLEYEPMIMRITALGLARNVDDSDGAALPALLTALDPAA